MCKVVQHYQAHFVGDQLAPSDSCRTNTTLHPPCDGCCCCLLHTRAASDMKGRREPTDLVDDSPNHEEMESFGEAKQSVDLDPDCRRLHHEPAHARQNRQLSGFPVDSAVKRLIRDCLESGLLHVQGLFRSLPDLRVPLRLKRSEYRQRSARGCGAEDGQGAGALPSKSNNNGNRVFWDGCYSHVQRLLRTTQTAHRYCPAYIHACVH